MNIIGFNPYALGKKRVILKDFENIEGLLLEILPPEI
jgi:hypothetical protein